MSEIKIDNKLIYYENNDNAEEDAYCTESNNTRHLRQHTFCLIGRVVCDNIIQS